jgi:hypothetical protein
MGVVNAEMIIRHTFLHSSGINRNKSYALLPRQLH